MGFGLEGVLNEAGDGLVFAEAGLRQDASTLGAATVPGRGAITARLRVPFWLIPGDLVLAAPVLALSSPQTLQKMAVQAANGGLLPWQAGIATPIGRFQFVLGREVGLSFYRSRRNDPMLIQTPGWGRPMLPSSPSARCRWSCPFSSIVPSALSRWIRAPV